MENQPTAAPQEQKEVIVKGSLDYEIHITDDGYYIKHTPDTKSDMAGVLITLSIHQKILQEVDTVRKNVDSSVKKAYNNRAQSLRRSVEELNATFNLLLQKTILEADRLKEDKNVVN
jgi:hypothetical protein